MRVFNPKTALDAVKALNEISTLVLDSIKVEKPLAITLARPKKKRTTGKYSQNHHLNGHIQQICEETGNDFQTVKLYIKKEALKRGYPTKVRDGEQIIDLWGNPIPISEGEANTVECGYLIEEVHILASDLGIILKENE